jgi:uncharacterized membrane protein
VSIGTAIGQFLVTGALFSALDVLWLGVLAKEFGDRRGRDPLEDQASRPATVTFYAVLIAVLVVLVTGPAIDGHGLWYAVLLGALVGLVAFAGWSAYEAFALGYPRILATYDALWGVVMCAVACGGTYTVWQWFS